jgi:alginate O-acetyltransferase complex protein AlgI
VVGNRKGELNTYLFMMITMAVGGIWHGASWNFMVWGIAHGLALVIHKWMKPILSANGNASSNIFTRFIFVFITFHLVSLLWIFFRAIDFKHAFDSMQQMINHFNITDVVGFYVARPEMIWMLLLATLLVFFTPRIKNKLEFFFQKTPLILIGLGLVILFQLILQIKNNEIAPFIYFQF